MGVSLLIVRDDGGGRRDFVLLILLVVATAASDASEIGEWHEFDLFLALNFLFDFVFELNDRRHANTEPRSVTSDFQKAEKEVFLVLAQNQVVGLEHEHFANAGDATGPFDELRDVVASVERLRTGVETVFAVGQCEVRQARGGALTGGIVDIIGMLTEKSAVL